MADSIINSLKTFRNNIYGFFKCRADVTMDLIDATAGQTSCKSIVQISLSPLFRRGYSSITDAIHNLFCYTSDKPLTEEDSKKEKFKLTEILVNECPKPIERPFVLFAADCTANPRIYAKTVEDRSYTHAPNHIPGQKPITIGHQYSHVVFLPENQKDKEAHWVIPLSVLRVKFSEKGHEVGMLQLREIIEKTSFSNQFCISVTDSAYKSSFCDQQVEETPNWVNICRLRSNRTLYRKADEIPLEERKKGRPRIYGEVIRLSNPPLPDIEETFTKVTIKEKEITYTLKRWNDLIAKGNPNVSFDLVQITQTDEAGKEIYKKPLSLSLTGKRRKEVDSKTSQESYGQRFDNEHYFRFGKQRLLNTGFSTPDTRHEENWMWVNMLAYNMLYHSRELANASRHPWESRKITILKNLTPSQVQRDYIRIIQEFGTPAKDSKPRGKSEGRVEGIKMPPRKEAPVLKKEVSIPKKKKRKKKKKKKKAA
jgi:hypothetical protein